MLTHTLKGFGFIIISFISIQALAADVIRITVKTQEKNAVAVGYRVDGKDMGALGKSYTGKGPIGKEYSFGYKKDSIFGDKIPCASLVLQQDATVKLVYQDNHCISIME